MYTVFQTPGLLRNLMVFLIFGAEAFKNMTVKENFSENTKTINSLVLFEDFEEQSANKQRCKISSANTNTFSTLQVSETDR